VTCSEEGCDDAERKSDQPRKGASQSPEEGDGHEVDKPHSLLGVAEVVALDEDKNGGLRSIDVDLSIGVSFALCCGMWILNRTLMACSTEGFMV